MDEPLGSLVDAIATLIDTLERAGLPYALGGAVAYSAWAEPRATRDVDLNLWVEPDGLEGAFDVLEEAGVQLDRIAARRDVRERGLFVGRHGEYRVDVFVPSVPFYSEALTRRRRVRLAGRDTWVLSAEALAVFKMLFYRPKDIADLGRLLEIQKTRFDAAFVRRWLVEMLGADDERVATWDRLVQEH
ncbi:MAG TPA: hypothetical protein VJ829_08020 [Candidatus Binatia bacterium]|nr:hypothetical protein [Candidatus Binatia bacterium]